VGRNKPSTEWPIQKFAWSDYDLCTGDTAQYRAVPMVGTKDALAAVDVDATNWSEAVTLGAECEAGMEADVNRGIVATQWVARSLGTPTSEDMGKKLTEVIATPGDRIRTFLSGALRPALLRLLSDLYAGGGRLYAALFELDDPELIPALTALGGHANVVLANGSVRTPAGDENAAARQTLKRAGVTVHDRMVRSGHLDHHKYLVLCDAGAAHAASGQAAPTGPVPACAPRRIMEFLSMTPRWQGGLGPTGTDSSPRGMGIRGSSSRPIVASGAQPSATSPSPPGWRRSPERWISPTRGRASRPQRTVFCSCFSIPGPRERYSTTSLIVPPRERQPTIRIRAGEGQIERRTDRNVLQTQHTSTGAGDGQGVAGRDFNRGDGQEGGVVEPV
jgi:hypothetical protein